MAQDFKERTITINLRKVYQKPDTKRAVSAKNMLKKAITKETRLKDIKISNALNELIWSRGRGHVPRKITIKVVKEKETARVMLPEEKYEAKKDKKDAKKGETKLEEKKEAPKAEAKKETSKTENSPKETPKKEAKKE